MPLTISEDHDSRKVREYRREGRLERNMERRFTIKGTDDPLDDELAAIGPQYGESWIDASKNLYVFDRSFEVARATGDDGILRLIVQYGPPERLPQNNDNEPEYEFSTAAETAHIEKAIQQASYPVSEGGVGELIGINGDKIDGVDIYIPKPAWSQTREVDNLSPGYVRLLTDLTGTVNDAAWKFWNTGEVLFLGAKARRRGFGKWRMDFQFAIQPTTQQNIQTESGSQVFTKVGWDYMWFSRSQESGDNQIVHSVRAAHVAKVYERRNFALLGLGVKV